MNKRRFLKLSAGGVLVAAEPSVMAFSPISDAMPLSEFKHSLFVEERMGFHDGERAYFYRVKGPRYKGDIYGFEMLFREDLRENPKLLEVAREHAAAALKRAYRPSRDMMRRAAWIKGR